MTKIVGVVFRNYIERNRDFDRKDETLYYYKIPPKMKVKIGDFLLVQIKNSNRKEIVRIETMFKDFFEYECEKHASNLVMPELDELICPLSKLDFTALEEYVKIKEKKEKLEKTIDDLYKKVSKLKILEAIAKEDKQLAELINEYKGIKDE